MMGLYFWLQKIHNTQMGWIIRGTILRWAALSGEHDSVFGRKGNIDPTEVFLKHQIMVKGSILQRHMSKL